MTYTPNAPVVSEPTLQVDEQIDRHGDIVFTISAKTYSRSQVQTISDALGIAIAWHSADQHRGSRA